MAIDLHSHSTASDGSFPPSEVAKIYAAAGIKLAALTDHDTLGGVDEFVRVCEREGITGCGGVEFSTVFKDIEVHLLGYSLPLDNERCRSFMDSHAKYLRVRCQETLDLMSKYGYRVDIEKVYEKSDGNPAMPPHILKVLYDTGQVEDLTEAIKFYWDFLSNTGKAWVPHETKLEAPLRMMQEVGAVSIVAHPLRFPQLSWLEELLDLGADGFELYYPGQDGKLFGELSAIAEKRGCLVSGGSDYHGAYHDVAPGEVEIRPEYIERFLDAIGMNIFKARADRGGKSG